MRKKLILTFSIVALLCTALFSAPVQAATFNINFTPNCKSIYLLNLDTDTPVYELNADERRAPASITKIMTYIIVSEHVSDPDNTIVTIDKSIVDEELSGTGSSLANLADEEQMSVSNLLRCLMIPSGNDAAVVLADYVGNGDIDAFVQMMNDKAAELGLANTHFMNPHGLHHPEHYTTARDMATITKYAMECDSQFMEITNTPSYILPTSNVRTDPNDYTLSLINTNDLIRKNSALPQYYYQYAKGIKTGWHDEAGRCLVSTATKDGYTYLCVAMGGDSEKDGQKYNGAEDDSVKLYEWAFDNLEAKSIVDLEEPVKEIPLELAWQKDTLKLLPAENIRAMLPKNVSLASIEIRANDDVPESAVAPVQKGQVFGTATITYANEVLGTVNLVSSEEIERSELMYYMQGAKNIITSKWFLIAATIFVLLFVSYLILSAVYNKHNKRKRRRKVRKYRKL